MKRGTDDVLKILLVSTLSRKMTPFHQSENVIVL